MNDYLETALSGWAGVILFASGLLVPYLVRRLPAAKTPYVRRLWPHYWLGYLALLVSFAHAWLTMRGWKHARRQRIWRLDRNRRAADHALADRGGAHVAIFNSIQSPHIAAHPLLDDDLQSRGLHRWRQFAGVVLRGGDLDRPRHRDAQRT